MDLLHRVLGGDRDPPCGCDPAFEGDSLVLAADDCEGRGDLVAAPGCRETAIGALTRRDASAVVARTGGTERTYDDRAVALLVAAGRFAERVGFHDERLADLARRDPLRAARDALARAGPVRDLAAETGLAAVVEDLPEEGRSAGTHPVEGGSAAVGNRIDGADARATNAAGDDPAPGTDDQSDESGRVDPRYRRALRAYVGPTVARSRVATRPPPGSRLVDVRDLDTGGVARIYEVDGRRRYHLEPPELQLDPGARATLAAAYDRLAAGDGIEAPTVAGIDPKTASDTAAGHDPGLTAGPPGGSEFPGSAERAPGRAVRAVADEDDLVVELTAALRKHTRGYGVLADLFADSRVTDVYATAPVGETTLRVVLDDETLPTNVRLTEDGARALASRLRRESGRAFSRASPTLDATADLGDGRVRAAGVTDPVSEGTAFAFRQGGREAWTLPALVANGTLPAEAAALLSVAVDRGAAALVAGPRGAGKTTTLGALLWELPPAVRTVLIEDTPELPVRRLLEAGRDVQALRVAADDGPEIPPVEAFRTALRLGEGALVIGEVRGEEARTLYEAMRVGASDGAVLGTIHGDGADAVRERVVSDLGVPRSSFGATDLVVSLASVESPAGRKRRVTAVEEVIATDEGTRFATLYDLDGTDLTATGRIDRGNSRLAGALAAPGESYADLLDAIEGRRHLIADLAGDDRTRPGEVTAAYATRGQP